MNDFFLLYSMLILNIALIIIIYSKYNRIVGIGNSICCLLYTLPLYCLLIFDGEYGSGFTYWFYLVTLTAIQILSSAIYMGLRLITKHKRH